MHEAKLGIGSDAQGRRKTAHRALGAVESHEDPRIGTARELVDEENGAFTEADDAFCRGTNHRLRIGNLAGGADENQIPLGRNPFPDKVLNDSPVHTLTHAGIATPAEGSSATLPAGDACAPLICCSVRLGAGQRQRHAGA